MRVLVPLIVLLQVAGLDVALADELSCEDLNKIKTRSLREWRSNHLDCTDDEESEATRDACELAHLFGERYHEAATEYERRCVERPTPPLRSG